MVSNDKNGVEGEDAHRQGWGQANSETKESVQYLRLTHSKSFL